MNIIFMKYYSIRQRLKSFLNYYITQAKNKMENLIFVCYETICQVNCFCYVNLHNFTETFITYMGEVILASKLVTFWALHRRLIVSFWAQLAPPSFSLHCIWILHNRLSWYCTFSLYAFNFISCSFSSCHILSSVNVFFDQRFSKVF